jgi:hypothetical protein
MKPHKKYGKLDKFFAEYIKAKAGKCEYCGLVPRPQGFHAAHYHSRERLSTRFDEENVIALCFNCHRKLHNSPDFQCEFTEWFKNRLGDDAFDYLTIRANTPLRGGLDIQAVTLYIQEKLKEVRNDPS